jgi:tetratricopeptide (TPR) repeat protein
MTRIISTTLAGSGTAPIIGDALRSVAGLVDVCALIWTGGDGPTHSPTQKEERATYSAARDVAEPGGRPDFRYTVWPWRNDFAAARNAALNFAETFDAEWQIVVDSDERVLCPDPAAVRAFLADLPPEVCVVVAFAADDTSGRERFFRLPARHRWVGRTHEAFPVDPGEQATIPPHLIAWSELPKDAERLRAKNERDVELLLREIDDHPDDARWWYYLGGALAGVGRIDDAINTFREAANRSTGEDGAMACVRAAELLVAEKRYEEAVACCARGMTMRADIAELPWIAGGASWNMGDRHQAEAFALIAKVHGERGAGRGSLARRVGFRVPRALREGPDEILRMCRPPVALTPSAEPIRITVTSTGFRAGMHSGRCVASVAEQVFCARRHIYVACDSPTYEGAWRSGDRSTDLRQTLDSDLVWLDPAPGLLANLLPIWRSLPDDEVIVWLDGDDWLATDSALATVAEMHAAGAWATYGQFIFSDGRAGFCEPAIGPPRLAPWTASHLKTFRAGLVKRIRDEDLRRPDGEYVDLAIDQAIMLPILEMAAERAVFCDRILAVYNVGHSFAANASAEERAREVAEVMRIRRMRPYTRLDAL